MIEGSFELQIAGRKLMGAPLNMKAVREYADLLDINPASPVKMADMPRYCGLIKASLDRNPEQNGAVAIEWLDEHVDMWNAQRLVVTILTGGGLEVRPETGANGAAKPGEGSAPAVQSQSGQPTTGATSMPS